MSTRIDLALQTKIDLEFLSRGIHLRLVRLLGVVQLKTASGWSPETRVIIDSGNPISLIPHSIWSAAEVRILTSNKTQIFGLGGENTQGLAGRLGEAILVFKDKQATSPPIKFKAHLMDDDSAPFLIGFEDILTETDWACSYRSQSAWIEV